MLALLFEFLGEVLLQVIGQLLLELGLRSLVELFYEEPHPLLSAIGFALFGAILGGLSTLAFSEYLVSPPWRLINLGITPLLVGGVSAAIAMRRRAEADEPQGLRRFVFGYLFALAFALARFGLAN